MSDAKSNRSNEARGGTMGSPTSNGRRRVVITGLGAYTPLGNDPEETWRNLLAGQSGAAEITHFDHADYPIHFACEVKEFDPAEWIERKQVRRMDRFAQLIVAAARQAERDSGLEIGGEADRIGASIATGIGGLQSFQDCYDVLLSRGPDRVNPFAIPCIIPNMGAGWVSMELGTRGPLSSECTACAASNMAIGQGLDDIRLGRADVMLCGGTESAINKVGIAGFAAMRALSRRNDDPQRASRPFDAERDGFVMGEAAAIVVLEELEHAKARGARIYAEVAGHGLSSDATHITEPDPTGENPARAMRNALRDAGVDPSDVDYVNAHGTSTPLGDASETRVIKMALGEEKARQTPISSTKGATGHCLGAGGAVEAVFTTLAIRDGKLPPTINYEAEDPECDLDYIPNVARDADVRVAVSNSFGFGGHNACVVLRQFDGDGRG
jgi:3-oxoacyl-[acyl-carrier-protein] synthase II